MRWQLSTVFKMARIYPLFSSSSGNSYFLGSKQSGILIDAGQNCKQICLALERCEIDPLAVRGIIITHEHSDHISGLRVFASKFNTPVFCSSGTKNALIKENIANGSFPLHVLEQSLQIADMEIKHFHTSHDCEDSLGFRIKTPDNKILSFATDLGYLSDEVKDGLEGCDFAVLESNYDVSMLQAGPYPYVLKKRIMSDRGHLSNKECSEYLPFLKSSGTKRFMLAHLSGENNNPHIAEETANCELTLKGYVRDVDYKLYIAPKTNLNGEPVIF